MTPLEIFHAYRAESRGRAYPGHALELFPHLVRHVAEIPGEDGFIGFADFPVGNAGSLIDEQVAYFKKLGQRFEWKVYDFDVPSTLKLLLEARGFQAADEEAFLVIEADKWIPPVRQVPGLRIERITDAKQLHEYVATEQEIWPSSKLSWHVEQYTQDLASNPGGLSIYCAYLNGKPVGTGRVRFPVESTFADLNGGGVVPTCRGRGIFTALLWRRIEEAKARGFRWLAVDAAPMSRPILLRKGFQHVCWTYPMFRE